MKQYIPVQIPTSKAFEQLVTETGSSVIASLLWNRGYTTIHALDSQEDSSKELLPYDELHDLASFWSTLKKHIEKKSNIAIYGDYDADGALAASILWRFLSKELGCNVTIYIPDRHEEGYGLNKEALLHLASQGIGLVITVDCGIRDAILIKEVLEQTDLDILVTDHHQPPEEIPAVPVVHPMHPERPSKNQVTSGGVVAWKVVRYVEQQMKLSTRISDSLIDLAGISLVTDIMPIVGENKIILKKAIDKLKRDPNAGIDALMQHAQVQREKLTTYHLGYIIGPRLNANGRIGDQYASARLLSTDKKEFAYELAQKIHEVNVKRQDLTKEMLKQAEAALVSIEDKLIISVGQDWDDGIIGLVAGRLMNARDIPTVVITVNEKKQEAKGSARSFGEFNITELLSKVSGHLTRFGGHHNAAGFSLTASEIEPLLSAFRVLIQQEYAQYRPVVEKKVDASLVPADLNESFFSIIEKLEPFGFGNPSPIFSLTGKVIQFNIIGATGTHVRYEVETERGIIKVLHFNGVERLAGVEQGRYYTFYGEPKNDEFNGRKQLSFIAEYFE